MKEGYATKDLKIHQEAEYWDLRKKYGYYEAYAKSQNQQQETIIMRYYINSITLSYIMRKRGLLVED